MRSFFFALLVLLPALAARADDAPGKCKLVRLADWHVRFLGTHPVLDGFINGKKIGVLIDTGAQMSLLTSAAAQRLDLQGRITPQILAGVGGGLTRVFLARVDDLRIGDFLGEGIADSYRG